MVSFVTLINTHKKKKKKFGQKMIIEILKIFFQVSNLFQRDEIDEISQEFDITHES